MSATTKKAHTNVNTHDTLDTVSVNTQLNDLWDIIREPGWETTTTIERVQDRVQLQPSVLGNKVAVQIIESMLAMWYVPVHVIECEIYVDISNLYKKQEY